MYIYRGHSPEGFYVRHAITFASTVADFPGNGHLRDTLLYLPIILFLKSDFEISLSLRQFICFACLEVAPFSISFLNIKHIGATAPPIF